MMNKRLYATLALAAVVATPMIAADAPHRDGQVRTVTLGHQAGTARLAIGIEGTVTSRHFVLADPARIVVDLEGATLGDVGEYDGLRRGAVKDVRVRQHEVNVVRVVLEFDKLPAYEVDQAVPGFIGLTYRDEPFEMWEARRRDIAQGNPLPLAPVTANTPAQAAPQQAELPSYRSTGYVPSSRGARDSLISIEFVNTPMTEVAEMFARYSGKSILVGPAVKSVVNGTIINKPWDQAFAAVLAQQGLSSMELPGGIIRIDEPGALAQLDSLERLETEMVRLNYAKASALVTSIKPMLTPGRGEAVADSSINGLIIRDTRTRIQQVVDFARSLDIKTPTVAITTKLIFVDRTDLQQLGFKYDIGTNTQFYNKLIQRYDPLTGQPFNPNVNVVNLGGSAISAISNADALISGSALDLAFSTAIGGFSVTSFLSALGRVEMTDVEAETVIHTLDNQQAEIISGEETPVRVIDASSFGQANQAPRANVEFKQTGIKLKARPSVTANREIRLEIEAERSSIQPLAAADLGFNIPMQTAKSTLLVADGETAVFGGLVQTTVSRNRSGIPMLSALPFIGNLFSFSEDRENRKDLIIMVTPRIVED